MLRSWLGFSGSLSFQAPIIKWSNANNQIPAPPMELTTRWNQASPKTIDRQRPLAPQTARMSLCPVHRYANGYHCAVKIEKESQKKGKKCKRGKKKKKKRGGGESNASQVPAMSDNAICSCVYCTILSLGFLVILPTIIEVRLRLDCLALV